MPATILSYQGKRPKIAHDAFVAPNAMVIGDVEVGSCSSIWYGCIVRGDHNRVSIGRNTNVQDNSVIHVDSRRYPTIVGDNVVIGHMCLIHACTLEDDCFIGMRSCVMDGAVVESGAMVAAGALVVPGKRVKGGQLWAGSPAKYLRDLTSEEIASFRDVSNRYVGYARNHIEEVARDA